jgi:hypothetical protein
MTGYYTLYIDYTSIVEYTEQNGFEGEDFMKKRILSLVLAMALVLAFVPYITLPAAAAQQVDAKLSSHYVLREDGTVWSLHGDTPKKLLDGAVDINGSEVLKSDGSLWVILNGDEVHFIEGSVTTADGNGLYKRSDGTLFTVAIIRRNNDPWTFSVETLETPDWLIDGKMTYINLPFISFESSWGQQYLHYRHQNPFSEDYENVPVFFNGEVIREATMSYHDSYFAFALTTDGALWDLNYRYMARFDPEKIADNVEALYSDHTGTYFKKTDNSLWGFHYELVDKPDGMLGVGYTQIKLLDDVAAAAYGYALLGNGALWDLSTGKIIDRDIVRWYRGVRNIYSDRGFFPSSFFLKRDGSLWLDAPVFDTGEGGVNYKYLKALDDVIDFNYSYALKKDGSVWEIAWYDRGGEEGDYSPVMILGPPDPLDTADTWAHIHINSANAKGFIPPALQNHYRQNITRAEFVTLAMSWLNYKTGLTNDQLVDQYAQADHKTRTFTDTSDPVILAAARLDITAGVGGGLFGPGQTFTRQQAAMMLTKVFAILGTPLGTPADFGFVDIATAADWAQDAINFVGNNGVMSGVGGNRFAPHETFTRQQSITVFNNMG